VNKYDFKSLQKLALLTLEYLRLSGNDFQADGPATEKARRPYVRTHSNATHTIIKTNQS